MAWLPDEIGDEFYSEGFGPLIAAYGEQLDLQAYLRGLGRMIQPIYDLSKDEGNGTNDEPGWSQTLDRTRAKDEWLRWLAQWVGYNMPIKPTDFNVERTKMVTRSAHRRGGIAILREVVQEHLSGTKTVVIQERTTDAGHISVFVYSSEIVTSTAEVQAAAFSQKAGGLIMTFTVVSGATYAALQAANTNYAEVLSVHPNYSDVQANPGL